MPVTFYPSKHGANPVKTYRQDNETPLSILRITNRTAAREIKSIIQTNLPPATSDIIPEANGFVCTVLKAYNEHNALVLRPDDVWITILTQFNFYVNANAEALRSVFATHEGQETLRLQLINGWGEFAKEMTEMIQKKLVDPEVRSWVLPSFTTTNENDVVVASVVMMATLKTYFAYEALVGCRLPQVTLDGEKSDWENILARASKLQEYGEQTSAWYRLLEPVLSRFIQAFDDPNSEANVEFWQTVIHAQRNGSGMSSTSGWISAFCVFNAEGKWLGSPITDIEVSDNEARKGIVTIKEGSYDILAIDGIKYHRVGLMNPPPSTVSVDVTFNNDGHIIPCMMTAGVVGAQIISSGDKSLSETGERDGLKPCLGWWVSEKRQG